jgi:hypothetical protein
LLDGEITLNTSLWFKTPNRPALGNDVGTLSSLGTFDVFPNRQPFHDEGEGLCPWITRGQVAAVGIA